jgi:hypothetical protein
LAWPLLACFIGWHLSARTRRLPERGLSVLVASPGLFGHSLGASMASRRFTPGACLVVRTPLLLLAVLMAVIVHAVSGLPMQVRFTYVPLNHWLAATLALWLPVMVLWVALRLVRRTHKVAGIVVSGVVALPSLAFAVLVCLEGSHVINNVDSSFELLSEAKSESASYRLYRTNCGATCAYGLVLRREYDSPLGVKLVSPVWSLYRASEGAVQVKGSAVRIVSGTNVLATIKQ